MKSPFKFAAFFAWILPLLIALAAPAAFAADLTITSVTPSVNAIPRNAIAGVAITAGKLVYKSATDSKLYLADGDSATAAVRDVIGIAAATVSAGTSCLYIIEDPNLTLGASITNGTIYGLSATAGGIAPAADFTTGWWVAPVMVGTSSSTVSFRAKGLRAGAAL